MSKKKKDDISERLLQWSTEEMGFQNKRLTAEDLGPICRGSMADIWEYVVRHVRDQRTVHEVKGNIRLHQLQQGAGSKVSYRKGEGSTEGDRDKLLKRRSQLQEKLRATRRDVEHLERDVRMMKGDMDETAKQYNEGMATNQQLNHRNTLLQAYHNQCRVVMATINEFGTSLKNKHQHYSGLTDKSSKPSQEMLFFSKERSDSTKSQGDVLETACTRQVREVCGQIQSNWMDVLQNKTQHQAAVKENKKRLWEQVEETLRTNSADEIVKSLTIITNEGASHLNQKTNQIDIKQDIEDLKFKYESGQGFVDLSSGKSELKSVQQLIMEKQVAHIQRFMEGEKNRTMAAKLNQELNHLVAKMEEKLAKRYASQPGELELAKTLFMGELNLVSASTALKVLKLQRDKQEAMATASKREKELLFAKYKQIQDFQKVTDKKQGLIQVLIKENLSSRKQLDGTRMSIQHYTQVSVCNHESGAIAMATSLKNSAANEIQASNDLSLEMLELTKLPSDELKATSQLSITRFKNTTPALGGDNVVKIQAMLGFPSYRAPERLLGHVIKMKCSVSDAEGLSRMRELLQAAISSPEKKDVDIIQHIKDLCKRVAEKDERQAERLCPILQSGLSEGAETINNTCKAKSDLTAWWDQPAQHLTPWVKVDDLSYTEWLDEWTMAVSEMKELTESTRS